MSYQGYLIKIGDFVVPMNKYIKADSYTVGKKGQDLDSYRDANGYLHRNALNHTVNKVEFETPAMLTDDDVEILMSNIERNYINSVEKKVLVTLYIPELRGYESQEMYIADIDFSIYTTHSGVVRYNPIKISMVGY